MNRTRNEKFAELRRRAEALLHDRPDEKGAPEESSKPLPELIHELEVHQVELEMQNHELRQTEERLEASEKKYADLYNFAPVGYFTFDRKGTILEANLTGASLLGAERQRLIGKPFPSFCTPESADLLYLHIGRVLKTQQPAKCELTLKRADGASFEVQLESVAAEDKHGVFNLCQSALSDITDRMRAENVLHESEEFKNAILDSVASSIAVLDLGGVIRAVNEPWKRFARENQHCAGEPPCNCGMGANYLEVCRQSSGESADGATAAHVGIQAVLEGRLPHFTLEYPCHSPNEQRWFSMSVTPLGKEVRGVVVSHSNITARRQAEEALRKLQRETEQSLAMLDTLQTYAPIGFAFVDRDLRYVRINEELAAINGIPAAAHLGRTVAEMVPDLWPQVEPLYRRILAGESVLEIEISGETAACPGERRHWQTSFYPVRLGGEEVSGVGIVILDITARKQAEELLRRQGEQLVEDDRRKNEFLGMMAHELRNPLAPIRNAVQLLRLGAVNEQSVKRQEEMIERQVSHMARLLDDLLDVSRIAQGKITLKKVHLDLRDVVDRALETSSPFVSEHGHRLHYDPFTEPLWLEGDGARLEQVICNLLNNSIKYTESGGQIWVTLEREASGDDPAAPRALIHIRDSGVGIAPEMLSRVFDLFTQAERSLDRSQGGLGIGLSLVRRLVEMHGGTIAAQSAGLGQGSEFVVRLPLLSASEATAAVWESKEPAATGHGGTDPDGRAWKILAVDDNVDMTNSLGELLETWGHTMRMAYDGAAGLAAAREFKPDIVLLDLGLPGLSGFEVATRLRAEPSLASTTIIALTGYGQDEDRRQALTAGCDDYLTKPVDLERLHDLLRQRPAR